MGQQETILPRVANSANRLTHSTILSPTINLSDTGVTRVALLFSLRLGPWQEIVRGIYRFAENKKSWILSIHTEDDIVPALTEKPDGIIAAVYSSEVARKLTAWGGPVIDTACECEGDAFVQMGFDPLAAGRNAAEHLLLLRGRSFACISDSNSFGQVICQGFVERLNQAGQEAIVFNFRFDHLHSAVPSDRDLADWLSHLPLPTAVFATDDSLAHRLARLCMSAGLKVPHQVAILGCSNDEFLCTVSQQPLSSVALPFATLGYEAAKLLDAVLSGVISKPKHQLPPLGVVTRKSTDPAAQAEPELAAALRFIRDHATARIGVDDIAAASGLSRSSLERRFRAVVGRSPLAELLRERIERAQHLLVQSDLAIKEVASAAGFHDVRHLSVTFRQKTGTSPGQYRARFRPG